MIITLPLPAQQLKPNVRCHYMAKAKHVATYRLAAKEAGMIAAYDYDLREPIEKPIVTVAAYWPTARRMDADNLLATMKAAFDGLTDAGIWTDDRECTFLPCHQCKDAANPRIEIQVEKREKT